MYLLLLHEKSIKKKNKITCYSILLLILQTENGQELSDSLDFQYDAVTHCVNGGKKAWLI